MKKNISLQCVNRKGFTLIEILLVVVIIASLASMVVPRLSGRSEQSKQEIAKTDLESHLATAIRLYELDNGNFPTTDQGLEALLRKPTIEPLPSNWNGPYIEKYPVDPWGNAYLYQSPGEHRSDYDLYSTGRDAESEDDDIVNWE